MEKESENLKGQIMELLTFMTKNKIAEVEQKIPELRKKSPDRFKEIKGLAEKLEATFFDELITDETQRIFKQIKTLWLEGLSDSPWYERTLYQENYNETENLSEKECKLLCYIRDVNSSQMEEFTTLAKKDFKNLMENLFDCYSKHPEQIPAFIKHIYTLNGDCECYFASLMYESKIEDETDEEDSKMNSYTSDEERFLLIKKICEVLSLKNDLSSVNFDMLRDNYLEEWQKKNYNRDVKQYYETSLQVCQNHDTFGKVAEEILKETDNWLKENTLSKKQAQVLLDIAKDVFAHDYDYSTTTFEMSINEFFDGIPMDIRNALFCVR